MAKELHHVNLDDLTQEDLAIGTGMPLIDAAEGASHELWRVVSADGSTRIFQTRPASEARSVKRTPVRRVTPCPLGGETDANAAPLFDRRRSTLPTLVTEPGPATPALAADSELSVELTSVTQAWPSLSPGIRGAVMALIRAASTGRPARPAAAPIRE